MARTVFNLNGYVFGALRRIWRWHPARREALKRANGQCEQCSAKAGKEVHVDHISPVVPVSGWVDWNTHFARLYVAANELMVLCKPCHKKKTKEENSKRPRRKASK